LVAAGTNQPRRNAGGLDECLNQAVFACDPREIVSSIELWNSQDHNSGESPTIVVRAALASAVLLQSMINLKSERRRSTSLMPLAVMQSEIFLEPRTKPLE